MNWFSGWLRTTFDYNPTFPLSALALIAGLRLLTGDGAAAGDAAGPIAGVGVVTGYELCLLAAALLVLWPRRISYETTAILIVFSIVRFAPPFLATSLAADGHLGIALAVGVGLTVAMIVMGEGIVRRVGLPFGRWERGYDYALFGIAAIGLPLLSERLSTWTGAALSQQGARLLQLAVWWGSALLLAPLSLGMGRLRLTQPLRSRRPAVVWRCLTALGFPALVFNALWLAGDSPPLFALLPFALLGAALLRSIYVAREVEAPTWLARVPAGLVALAVLCPQTWLLGRVTALPQSMAVVALAGACIAAIPLLAHGPERLRSLRALGVVSALAPFGFASSLASVEVYGALLAGAVFVGALLRKRYGVATVCGLGLLVAGRGLLGSINPGLALVVLAFLAIPAGTAIALRREGGRASDDPATPPPSARPARPSRPEAALEEALA